MIILQVLDKKHVANIFSTKSNVTITVQYPFEEFIANLAKKFQLDAENSTYISNLKTNHMSKTHTKT